MNMGEILSPDRQTVGEPIDGAEGHIRGIPRGQPWSGFRPGPLWLEWA